MKYRVVIEHIGYLQDKGVGLEGDPRFDMKEQTTRFRSAGWDEPIEEFQGDRYFIDEIDVPTWADPIQAYNDYAYRRLVTWVRLFAEDPDDEKYSRLVSKFYAKGLAEPVYKPVVEVACKVHKSAFLESVKAQIWTWVEDPDPKYHAPLSPRQIAALSGRSR